MSKAKYATINKRKQQAALPKHRSHVLNAAPRQDQPPIWSVVCTDCAHEWRKTNAFDHGSFTLFSEAMTFAEQHNKINRFIQPERRDEVTTRVRKSA